MHSALRARHGLRARWTRAFAFLIVILVICSAGSALGTRIVSSGYRDTARQLEAEAGLLSRLQGEVVTHAALALTADTPTKAATLVQLEAPLLADFAAAFDVVHTDRSTTALVQAQVAWTRYAAAIRDRPYERAAQVRDLVASRVPPVLAAIDQLALDSRVATRAQLDRSGRVERTNLIVLGAALTLALGMCLRLLGKLSSEILQPVEALRTVALRLAAGELSIRVTDLPRNEVGELGITMNAMADALEANHERLEQHANHDALTGLRSRRAFTQALEQTLARPADGVQAVVFIDLDGFKAVNDQHGHLTGDNLLRVVAERLHSLARPGDVVARLGGDEFAILLTGLPDEGAVRSVLARTGEAVRAPVVLSGLTLQVGASAGYCLRSPEQDVESILHAADQEMYRVKASARAGAKTTPIAGQGIADASGLVNTIA